MITSSNAIMQWDSNYIFNNFGYRVSLDHNFGLTAEASIALVKRRRADARRSPKIFVVPD